VLVEQYEAQVTVALGRAERGPVGAETGFLSASIAEMIAVNEQAEAWEAAKAVASAIGREPTVADLPEGFQPVERKHPEEWVDVDVHIHNVRVQGEHAWAIFTFGTDRLKGNLLHMTFTKVDGQWYISSARGEGDA
jgi:3-oxoacyl-ACP reductase-like protein